MDNKRAIEYFKQGFNCSQAILATFGPKLGIGQEVSLKIATSFGGGMARQQHVCGAVTGAYMVLGLQHGKFREGDDEPKEKTYKLVHEFNKKFIEMNGSIMCREILGEDMNTEQGKQNIKEKNLYKEKCFKAIEDSAKILNELL